MNVQVRRKIGDQFTSNDVLEVLFDADDTELSYLLYNLEVVSGQNVTHGGGASADTKLNYFNEIEHEKDNGFFDYSTVDMTVVQEAQGTSVIKVVATYVTHTDMVAYTTAKQTWLDGDQSDAPPTMNEQTLKTGELTLSWSTDTLV